MLLCGAQARPSRPRSYDLDSDSAFGASLVRRGDGAHAPGSPGASASSEMSWGTLNQLLAAIMPAESHQAGASAHVGGSSGPAPAHSGASSSSSAWKQWIVSPTHSAHSSEKQAHPAHEQEVTSSVSQHVQMTSARGKQPAEHASNHHRHADATAPPSFQAVPKPIIPSSASHIQVPPRTTYNFTGQRRKKGPVRGRPMPAVVRGRDGELRPRKRPGPKKGFEPWNTGLDLEAQQAYRLNKKARQGR